jgi:two-component system cell cycle response regulator
MVWSWLIAAVFALACSAALYGLRRERVRIDALTASLEACNARAEAHARELERQALEDGLTGLHNRRYMDSDLPRELERSRRFGREFTLAILDVDGFKQINDRHSHQLGDHVLAEIAAILQSACRGMDGIVRYGGDEIILYFPETPLATGQTVCRRVLQRIRTHGWSRLCPGLTVSVSIGLASSRGAATVEELLETADAHLREAKCAGKDQLRCGVASHSLVA